MNGWVLGYVVGAVVVLVVVVALLLMIRGAHRTAGRVEAVLAALNDTRDGTDGLWQVAASVSTADRIVGAAADARLSLTPGGRA